MEDLLLILEKLIVEKFSACYFCKNKDSCTSAVLGIEDYKDITFCSNFEKGEQ